jgi:hypothetical protein
MNIQEPASDWPSVNESWRDIVVGSGPNPNPATDLFSASSCPSEETQIGIRHDVLIVEDNESDMFLIREAIEGKKIPVSLRVVKDGEQACSTSIRWTLTPRHPVPLSSFSTSIFPGSRVARF